MQWNAGWYTVEAVLKGKCAIKEKLLESESTLELQMGIQRNKLHEEKIYKYMYHNYTNA